MNFIKAMNRSVKMPTITSFVVNDAVLICCLI